MTLCEGMRQYFCDVLYRWHNVNLALHKHIPRYCFTQRIGKHSSNSIQMPPQISQLVVRHATRKKEPPTPLNANHPRAASCLSSLFPSSAPSIPSNMVRGISTRLRHVKMDNTFALDRNSQLTIAHSSLVSSRVYNLKIL